MGPRPAARDGPPLVDHATLAKAERLKGRREVLIRRQAQHQAAIARRKTTTLRSEKTSLHQYVSAHTRPTSGDYSYNGFGPLSPGAASVDRTNLSSSSFDRLEQERRSSIDGDRNTTHGGASHDSARRSIARYLHCCAWNGAMHSAAPGVHPSLTFLGMHACSCLSRVGLARIVISPAPTHACKQPIASARHGALRSCSCCTAAHVSACIFNSNVSNFTQWKETR